MKKIVFKAIAICFALTSYINLNAHFGSKGPFGGSVSCMTSYDSTVYVGTFTGGVYESTSSKLTSWRARPVGLKQGHITALAHTGKALFAASADSGVYRFTGYDVNDRYWESTNKGLEGQKITCMIAIDSNSLMVGTNGGGLFITKDFGATWNNVNNSVLHHYGITGLVKVGSRIFHTAIDGGIWGSDDLGASWYDYNDGNTYHIDGTSLINYNSTTNQLMVLNETGLLKSTVIPFSETVFPSYSYCEQGLPNDILIKSISNNGTTWFLSTNKGVYSSPSDIISWSAINTGLTTQNITSVTPLKGNLICGTMNEGIFKSTNSPISWVAFNSNFNNIKTYSMATSNDLIVAATEKGVYVSTNLATSYSRANNGLTDSLNVTDLAFANSLLFASTKNAGVFISTDTGKTWTNNSDGLMTMNVKKIFCNPISSMKYIICADGKIYKSKLNETDWVSFNTGINGTPTSMAFFESNIILTTSDNGVYICKNQTSWTQENEGLSNLKISSATFSGAKLFIGTLGSGVWKSDTSNFNWNKVDGNPINKHTGFVNNFENVNNIQSMYSNAGWVFAGYKGGLFATSDSGSTWIAAGNQFNLPTFTNVNKISIATGRVFVTTENNSLYSNGLSELPPILINHTDEILKSSEAFNIYPNPSSGVFNIEITNKKINTISIFNSNGVLLDEFDANSVNAFNINYPTGSYIVKLNANDTIFTQKLIIK
jgi:photosystem II stability/assembly factor-like uncharacterized protein